MQTTKFAFLFPGQGSQKIGMLADLASQYPEIKSTYNQASSVLNYDLWELTQQGPANLLNQTEYTQPALLTASYALWRLFLQYQLPPIVLAGHSLGEYTALVCAEAISFADAVQLVAARGQFMQEAVLPGEGAMAAVLGLADNVVLDICEELSSAESLVAPANYNSIGQVVVAGHRQAVERVVEVAKNRGARAIILPVSVPSHCELMRPAAHRLAAHLKTIPIQMPKYPIINNVAASVYQSVEEIREGLVAQLYQPVRWVQTITTLAQMAVTAVIECGPGAVLSGLNKRIDKSLVHYQTYDRPKLQECIDFIQSIERKPHV